MCPTAEQKSIWKSELSRILQVHDTNLALPELIKETNYFMVYLCNIQSVQE